MIRWKGEPLPKPVFTEVTDPVVVARAQKVQAQGKRNMDWLQAHWAEVIPPATGKYVAIAGQEAFLGETSAEACAKAAAAHPEDEGMFVWYVSPEKGIRIYVDRWELGSRD
jgi:hypothetical protein